ncbi:MAG: uracil-DNA glycosylase [Myxococcales bacterium]|nr:MAG: uracil-DNA glycosylase [Myxococcales bacterium]
MSGELDPLSELRFLSEALRAHAEWQQACGAHALPADVPVARPQPPELTAAAPVAAQPPPAPELRVAAAEAAPRAAPALALTLDPAERQHRLSLLAEQVKGCTQCALHEARTQTVFSRGNGSSGLCFVGEGPGADEDAQGFPFVGAAGQLLDRMIAAMGIARDDVYVCNIVKCRPPQNRTPEPAEMSSCMPYLTEQLALVEPQVIVALGKTAVQGLFGSVESITRIRGRWRLYQGRIAVMPTFHPAYLLRNPAGKREVWADLQLVLKHLGRTVPGKGA